MAGGRRKEFVEGLLVRMAGPWRKKRGEVSRTSCHSFQEGCTVVSTRLLVAATTRADRIVGSGAARVVVAEGRAVVGK